MLIRIRLFQFRYMIKYLNGLVFNPINIALLSGIVTSMCLIFVDGNIFEFSRPKDGSIFFSAAGLVGGALAIIVTLNTLLLQNALEKLPARNYQKFSNHNGLNFIYFMLATITVALFYCGISYLDISGEPRGNLLRIGLGMIVWALILIFLYLRIVIRSTNPMRQVVGLSQNIRKKIDETEELVSSYLKIISTNTDQDIISERNIRNQVRPRVIEVLTDLSDMAGLYNRFNERGDTQVALNCIQTISASGTYIYNKRKDSAIAVPTDNPLSPKSELSDVSLKIDEILLPIWEEALRNDDKETIREVLKGYQSMVYASIDVNHRNYANENPLMSYTFGGMKNIVELGLKSKNVEAIFQSADVLQKIAIHIYAKSAQNRLSSQYYKQCFDLLNLIYTYAVVNNETAILKNGLEAALYTFAAAMLSPVTDRNMREMATKKFSATLQIANSSNNKSLVAGDEVMIQELMIRNIFSLPKNVRTKDVKLLVARTQLMIEALADSTDSSDISFNLSFERFYVLTGQAFADIMSNYTKVLNDKIIEDINEIFELLIRIQRNSIVNYKYGRRADGDAEIYADQLSIIGMDATKFKNNELALNIINSLMDSAEWMLDKANAISGIDRQALQAVEHAGLIASISHTQRQYAVSREYKSRVRDFETKYLAKIFPGGVDPDTRYMPSPNAVRHLFDQLTSGRGGSGFPQYFETPEDKALSLISAESISTFNDYIWRDLAPPQNLPDRSDRFDLF